MTTLQLSLPDSLKEFLDVEAAAKGFASAGDYVAAILRAVQKRQAWDNLEPLVLEGLASPAREMTETDWQALHARIDHIELHRKRVFSLFPPPTTGLPFRNDLR